MFIYIVGFEAWQKPQKISTRVLTKTKQRQALEEWTRLMISHQQQKALIKMSFLGWKVGIIWEVGPNSPSYWSNWPDKLLEHVEGIMFNCFFFPFKSNCINPIKM